MAKTGEFLPRRPCSTCKIGTKYKGRCRICQAARTRARKYGISLEQALAIPEVCMACSENKPLFIDHDHNTGAFRGWLCHDCNAALGRVNDSIDKLQKLAKYLRTHWGDAKELSEEGVYGWAKRV